MPITWLDILLLGVMLVSGLLAMIRGFMREILSITAWAAAAVATLLAYPRLLPIAKANISSDIVATGAVIGGVFLITLLIVSILTVRISDMILDSRIGALDRTLGFLFGLGRGLIIVVVAFLFFAWLVPGSKQPDGVLQEAYGHLCVHYAIRWLMHAVAVEAGHDPDRLSFTRTLRAARRTTASHAGFSPSGPDRRPRTDPR